MFALGLLIPIVLLAALFLWFRRSQEGASAVEPAHGRISLLTEAVSYVGAVLVLAGAGVALGQRWDDLADGTRLGLLAGFALFFLGVGFVTRRSAEPALLRLTSVVWLIGTGALAGALVELFAGIVGPPTRRPPSWWPRRRRRWRRCCSRSTGWSCSTWRCTSACC